MTLNEYQQAAQRTSNTHTFTAEIASGFCMTLDEIAQRNIEKLKARYPDGFDPERSQHRVAGDV